MFSFFFLVYAILGTVDCDLIYEELLAVITNDIDNTTTNNTDIPKTSRDILAGRQISMEYETTDSVELQNETTTRVMYVKTAFTLFDFLFKWSREQKSSKNSICEPVLSKIIIIFFLFYIYYYYCTYLDFLTRFCKLKLAEKSLEFDEYARALLYLEDYLHDNQEKLHDYLPTLSVRFTLNIKIM